MEIPCLVVSISGYVLPIFLAYPSANHIAQSLTYQCFGSVNPNQDLGTPFTFRRTLWVFILLIFKLASWSIWEKLVLDFGLKGFQLSSSFVGWKWMSMKKNPLCLKFPLCVLREQGKKGMKVCVMYFSLFLWGLCFGLLTQWGFVCLKSWKLNVLCLKQKEVELTAEGKGLWWYNC